MVCTVRWLLILTFTCVLATRHGRHKSHTKATHKGSTTKSEEHQQQNLSKISPNIAMATPKANPEKNNKQQQNRSKISSDTTTATPKVNGEKSIEQQQSRVEIEIGQTKSEDFYINVTHLMGSSANHVDLVCHYGVSLLTPSIESDVILARAHVILQIIRLPMEVLTKLLQGIRSVAAAKYEMIGFINSSLRYLVPTKWRSFISIRKLEMLMYWIQFAVMKLKWVAGLVKLIQGTLCIRFPTIPDVHTLSFGTGLICPFRRFDLGPVSAKVGDGKWDIWLPFNFDDVDVVLANVTMRDIPHFGTYSLERFNFTVAHLQANFTLSFSIKDVIPILDLASLRPQIGAVGCKTNQPRAALEVKTVIGAAILSCIPIVNSIKDVIADDLAQVSVVLTV